ncbi:large conductance mechanosensitive channel [Raineyella antarctica]|uniref:Large conductance mechanosensitive channel n=1 Tax=Raineyella antarctica TaxID=1577474 RepID=A0A1G6GE92_9ACTN|nr:MscL family protein [Raineyella antarctica]SDB80332.1 large conductance mechanosensitive channel [Raineyella antarctica]
MKGFKEFLMRGNLIELAVAFIIGSVFAAVVKAFTDLMLDLIGKLLPIDGAAFSGLVVAGITIGPFVSAVVTFVLTAFVVYFAVVKPYNLYQARHKVAEPEVQTTDQILVQIRDLLAERREV